MKVARIFLTALGVLATVSLGASPAMATCADWDLTSEPIAFNQSNSTEVRLALVRDGDQLSGSARASQLARETTILNQDVLDVRNSDGRVDGRIVGSSLRLKITWNARSIGIYTLDIDADGRITGESYDFVRPSSRARVLGDRPLPCLPPAASRQDRVTSTAGGNYAPPPPPVRESATMPVGRVRSIGKQYGTPQLDISGVSATNAGVAPVRSIGKARTTDPAVCRSGFVWRVAREDDLVCVTPESRSRVARENASASSRWDPGAGYGPYGCVSGFVWREAFPGDVVCVVPQIRAEVARENESAAMRRQD